MWRSFPIFADRDKVQLWQSLRDYFAFLSPHIVGGASTSITASKGMKGMKWYRIKILFYLTFESVWAFEITILVLKNLKGS